MNNEVKNIPAFPNSGDNTPEHQIYDGMTLRDYFIAHAPAEPQPWFEPVMPEKPAMPDKYTELNDVQRQQFESELYDFEPDQCLPEVRSFCERLEGALEARREWDAERLKQRYMQWPAAWADAMLAQRAKGE